MGKRKSSKSYFVHSIVFFQKDPCLTRRRFRLFRWRHHCLGRSIYFRRSLLFTLYVYSEVRTVPNVRAPVVNFSWPESAYDIEKMCIHSKNVWFFEKFRIRNALIARSGTFTWLAIYRWTYFQMMYPWIVIVQSINNVKSFLGWNYKRHSSFFPNLIEFKPTILCICILTLLIFCIDSKDLIRWGMITCICCLRFTTRFSGNVQDSMTISMIYWSWKPFDPYKSYLILSSRIWFHSILEFS